MAWSASSGPSALATTDCATSRPAASTATSSVLIREAASCSGSGLPSTSSGSPPNPPGRSASSVAAGPDRRGVPHGRRRAARAILPAAGPRGPPAAHRHAGGRTRASPPAQRAQELWVGHGEQAGRPRRRPRQLRSSRPSGPTRRAWSATWYGAPAASRVTFTGTERPAVPSGAGVAAIGRRARLQVPGGGRYDRAGRAGSAAERSPNSATSSRSM